MNRCALLGLTALALVAGGAPALAGPPTPTPPGRSTGIAEAYSAYDWYANESVVGFVLQGTLAFGNVTHTGRFLIEYKGGNSKNAPLREGTYDSPPIGSCTSYDSVSLSLPVPGAAVVKCRGHFPEKGGDKLTTLVFALPDVESCGVKCDGYSYVGRYAG